MNPLESLLSRVPTRTLRIVVLPTLLSLITAGCAYAWAAGKSWKDGVDAVVRDAPALSRLVEDFRELRRIQLEQYRDQLAFQRDVYRELNEQGKADAADVKAVNLPTPPPAPDTK